MDIDQAISELRGCVSLDISDEGIRFVGESLNYAMAQKPMAKSISPAEFADGFADLAKKTFGGLALAVLRNWGFHKTSDLGRCVFALIDVGFFVKSEGDAEYDFDNLYDFEQRFDISAVVRETCPSLS